MTVTVDSQSLAISKLGVFTLAQMADKITYSSDSPCFHRARKVYRPKESSVVKRSVVALLVFVVCGMNFVSPTLAQKPTTNPATPKVVINPAVQDPVDAKKAAADKDKAKADKAAKTKPTPKVVSPKEVVEPAEIEPAESKRPRSETFLPAATKAWLSIPDADDLDERFNQTQFGALSRQESIKPFADHLKSQAKEWVDQQNIRLNLNIDDLHGVHSGEICFAGVLPEDADGEPISGQHGLVFIMDVSKTAKKAEELQVKINAELKKRGALQTEAKINGVDYIKSVIDKPKTFRKKRYNFQAIVNGWMLVSNNEAVFRDVVGRLANPKKIQPVQTLAAQKSFQTVMTNTNLGDYKSNIRWFIDPFGYIQLAKQIKDDEAVSKIPRDDLSKKFKNAGFEAFRGIGGNIAVATGKHEILHKTFTVAGRNNAVGNQRFFDLFDFSTSKRSLAPPTWTPADASSVVVGNWNFDRALNGVGHFFDVFTGQEGDFERTLNDLKVDPELQLDIKKLVGSFDDQLVIIAATDRPITADSERVVAGVPIKGDYAFVFNSIKRAHPEAKVLQLGKHKVIEYDSTIEPEYDDSDDLPIFDGGDLPTEEEQEEEEADEPKFELFEKRYFVVPEGEGFLLIANDKNYLRKVLAQRDSKMAEAKDYLEVKEAIAELTEEDKICWRQFGRLDATLENNYEMLRRGEMASSQTVLARILNRVAAKQAEEEAIAAGREVDPNQVRKQELDGAKLPADYQTMIAPFLGPIGGVLEAEEDGWRITGCFLKKTPKEKVVRKVDEKDETPDH